MALDLHRRKRLVLKAANEPVPKDKDGGIDWASVTCVRIVLIGDYHD